MRKGRIRVLCVDDHPLVREAIARRIELQPDMEVTAVASNGRQAVELFRRHRPDVTLMDLQLPVLSGIEAIRAIRAEDENARIITLTMYDGDERIVRALRAGAITYVLKSTLPEDLVRVIREVNAGKRPIPRDVASYLSERSERGILTEREIEIVDLLAAGKRNKEISAFLRISEDTVETHLRNIFAKLNVKDRTEAVTVALRRGMIDLK